MSLPVILRPLAEADVREIHSALEAIGTGLGDRFLFRLQEVLERIERFPGLYGVVWKDVRAARLKRFRHVVYYVIFPDRVEVLAVIHGARDAGAWQSRA